MKLEVVILLTLFHLDLAHTSSVMGVCIHWTGPLDYQNTLQYVNGFAEPSQIVHRIFVQCEHQLQGVEYGISL